MPFPRMIMKSDEILSAETVRMFEVRSIPVCWREAKKPWPFIVATAYMDLLMCLMQHWSAVNAPCTAYLCVRDRYRCEGERESNGEKDSHEMNVTVVWGTRRT